MDRYSIDSHKMIYHPCRVAEWINCGLNWGKLKKIYPIYVEISPVGACNHRCVFCSVDYLGHDSVQQDELILLDRIREMSGLGVKSIMFAGEGEPSLWKPLPDVLDACFEIGVDTSMTTNMVPFNSKNSESFVRNCKWIKASINGGNENDYGAIHQTQKEDFRKVISNFSRCVEIKNHHKYECVLGGQMLLLPDNEKGAVSLARKLRDVGADYLVIKPYTQSQYGVSRTYEGQRYDDMLYLEEALKEVETDDFKIVFRVNAMNKLLETAPPYAKCYSTPNFWGYIMANGNVYTCQAFVGDERFCVGNINEKSFADIWEGDKREEQIRFMAHDFDISECRKNCRMDEVNRYLWELKNPGQHVNFI